MERMFAFMRAILVELKFFLNIAPVFTGCVIAPLALCALKGYQLYHCFLACHIKPLKKIIKSDII